MRTHPARLGGNKICLQRRFYKQINTLHLDFTAREAQYRCQRESLAFRTGGGAHYQLKDRQTFGRLVYQQLLEEGDILLAAISSPVTDLVISPEGMPV